MQEEATYPMADPSPKQKLYDVLVNKGYYTKSFDDFQKQYSTPESIDKIYSVVSGDGLYTKTKDDFFGQYFSDVKKKDVGGAVGGQNVPSGSKPTASPSNPPSLSDADITKIKDFATGTTQEQRNQEHLAQAKTALPKQKPLTQAVPAKKITPKEVAAKGKEAFEDPLFQVWLQNSEDPVGELHKEAEAGKSTPIDIHNYDASKLHNDNAQAITQHVADVVKNGLFAGGHDAAAYLKRRGIGQDAPRPLTETEQVAVDKVAAAKEKNDLLNQYTLEESALRKRFPDLEGKTAEQFKRENNAQAGEAYAEFIQDPDVQERAKHDARLRLQLLNAQNNLVQHFPEYASAQVAGKISQKLEDAGKMNWLANNPRKEDADWAVSELEKEGKLTAKEKELYQKDLVPKIQNATSWTNELAQGIPVANAFADENPIKSRGIFENALSSFRNTLKGSAKTVEEATVAPALSLFSKDGLRDYHNQGLNEQLKQTYFEPKGFGKYTTTFGNIVGMVAPTILGAQGLEGIGASKQIANGLSFAFPMLGDFQATAREKFKGNPVMQSIYTASMGSLTAALGGAFASGIAKGTAGTAIKDEVANAVKGYATGELSAAAAKDMVKGSLLRNGFDFAKETAIHNAKGAGMMAGPQVLDLALDNIFGDHPPQFKEATEKIAKEAVAGFWASTPLSAVAALGSRNSKMGARMLYEQASRPEFREEMIAAGATPEQLKNYDAAQKILREIRESGVATKDLPQLLLHEVNQKILSEKASETESPSIKAQLREQINTSKEKAQTILNRQEVDLRPQDAEGKAQPSVVLPTENKSSEAITIAPKEPVKEEKRSGVSVILPQSNKSAEIIPIGGTEDVSKSEKTAGEKAENNVTSQNKTVENVPQRLRPEEEQGRNSSGSLNAEATTILPRVRGAVEKTFGSIKTRQAKTELNAKSEQYLEDYAKQTGQSSDKPGISPKEESPANPEPNQTSQGAEKGSGEEATPQAKAINPAVHETRTAWKSEQVNPAETKPSTAPKPKASDKLRSLAQKVRESKTIFDTNTTLPEGTQKMGASFNPKEAVAAAIEAVADALDKGAELKDAIERGWQQVRDHYRENGAKFRDEDAFRRQFTDHVTDAFREEPPAAEPPLAGQSASSDGGDNWTAIRKEKLKEIAMVREHFEKETGTTWTKIQQEGLEKVADAYPEKTLPDAIRAYTMHHAAMYDAKEDFNPTAKDLAVFQEFKRQTEVKKQGAGQRLNSDNYIERMVAISEIENYDGDLLAAAKAINPREAGTAFAYRQSESRMNPNGGLETRQMEMIKAKGGRSLTDSEKEWLKKQWEEEKAILEEKARVREQGMQEEFDRKIEELRKQYETTLKKARATTDKQARIIRQKTLSQKGKEVADKIRKLKTPKDGLKMDFSLGTWDLAVEGIAKLVEKGATIAEAIDKLIEQKIIGFKTEKDKEQFETRFATLLDTQDLRDSALEKLKEFDGETDVTNDMVAKGVVRDFVNSFIGEVEQKNLLDVATKELQEHLPSLTKKRLLEAYLKEGEFRQPTRKEMEGSLAQQKKELVSIAKLTEDLADLDHLKAIRQRNFPTEREKSAYEKELFDKKQEKLEKLRAERAELARNETDAQKRKDKLMELDANIRRAKEGLELITTYRKKATEKIDEEISKKRQELAKVIKDNLPDEREQKIKLKNAKDQRSREIKRLEQRLKNGDFEPDHQPSTALRKRDAELIKLDRRKAELEGRLREKQRELMDKDKHWSERMADFARSAYVALLIGGMKTMGKVGAMSLIRPFSEAVTKATMGKVFDVFFPNISTAAKRGGESSSLRSIQAGFEAYFRQMGAEKMQALYQKANTAFEQAHEAWQEAVDNGANAKTIKQLKTDRDEKLLKAMGATVYQYIGGSSMKDAWEAFVRRANEIEAQFGHVGREQWKGKVFSIPKENPWVALDNFSYVLGFVGRSHSALKTLSGRFSFAAGFMARLEQASKDGLDITRADKLLEIGHESYLDWERGKYQQENAITRWWNRSVLGNHPDSEYPEWSGTYKAIRQFVKADVAITRVPINILHEAVMEYTLGAFRSVYMAMKQYKIATKGAKDMGLLVKTPEFEAEVKRLISTMDEKQAATIARCFRKGSIGIGLYAFFAITGLMHFGGLPHLGQRKHKEENEQAEDELNPGQVQFGKTKVGEFLSGVVEHTPAMWPTLFGTGIAYEYKTQIDKGKTSGEAAWKALYAHLQALQGGIPMAKKFDPLGMVTKQLYKPVEKRAEEWGLVDEEEAAGHHKPHKAQKHHR